MRAFVLILAACSASEGSGEEHGLRDDPVSEPPRPVQLERKAMVDFHMQRHFDDLRSVEKLLIAGKLDDAKSAAFLLTKPSTDPGMKRWDVQSQRVTDAAVALSESPGLDEALRRETRVAAACGSCHLAIQRIPKFAATPPLPADAVTPASRMARHAWAVDRLWEGLVAPADAPWRRGLTVLATSPLPFSPATDAPALAAQLQRLANHALEMSEPITLDHQAAVYGEMLETCAACHTTLHPKQTTP